MKKLLYYVILVAIFIVLDLIVCFGYAIANLKAGGIIFNALLIVSLLITGSLSPIVKKWIGLEEAESEDKEKA